MSSAVTAGRSANGCRSEMNAAKRARRVVDVSATGIGLMLVNWLPGCQVGCWVLGVGCRLPVAGCQVAGCQVAEAARLVALVCRPGGARTCSPRPGWEDADSFATPAQ